MDADAAKVATEVLDYLARHPLAADTAAGIANWWLTDGPRVPASAVQEALDDLVASGALHRRRLPSGELFYSASKTNSATNGKAG